MKRIIVFILSITIAMSVPVPVVAEEHSEKLKELGDINGDLIINATDALQCLKNSAGLIVISDEAKNLADVNFDLMVTAEDALLILKYSANIISDFGFATPKKENYLLNISKINASNRCLVFDQSKKNDGISDLKYCQIANVPFDCSLVFERNDSFAEFTIGGGYKTLCFAV